MPLDPNTGYPVCTNQSCRRYGHSHPNCHCHMAKGGIVAPGNHFCSTSQLHELACPFYSHGGPVYQPPPLYADGGEVGDVSPQGDSPDLVMGHYSQNKGLLDLLTKAGQSSSPDQMKHLNDYMDASERGKKGLNSNVDKLYKGSLDVEPKDTDKLRKHIDELEEDPSKLLDVGGDLHNSFPEHGAQIAATAATALNYFKTLKPRGQQTSPLDTPTPPDPLKENSYNRQLHVAENPSIVLQHLHGGTLLPQDVITVRTLYPKMYEAMSKQVTEGLIAHKSKGGEVPYKQRLSMSLLLGQPLDFSQTPQAKQAIVMSAGPQQQQRLPTPKKNSHGHTEKPTSAELKQIDKTDELSETPLESRLINKHKA